jgi:hypothetical protein
MVQARKDRVKERPLKHFAAASADTFPSGTSSFVSASSIETPHCAMMRPREEHPLPATEDIGNYMNSELKKVRFPNPISYFTSTETRLQESSPLKSAAYYHTYSPAASRH